MSNFRDVHNVFSDFITDFDIFSDDETETKKWPRFYLERDIINYYENEYKLFKNDMNTYINIFLCELKQIKTKEENICSNEQKWRDVKLYKICIDINITYDMLYKPNIIFYYSNFKNKIDKKYDDEFKDLTRYYKKHTKNFLMSLTTKRKNLFKI